MFEKLKSGLKKLKEYVSKEDNVIDAKSLTKSSDDVKIGFSMTPEIVDKALNDLEIDLLSSDVALEAIEKFKANLKEELEGKTVPLGTSRGELVERLFKESLYKSLRAVEYNFLDFISSSPKPVSIMFVGINGSGKTTTIAKVAFYLKEHGITSVIAAGDTFRAGAIEQISYHGEKLGIRVIKHKFGADPAAVAFDAVEHAKAKKKDCVLIDTAGRMHTNTNLMDEMKKIKRVVNPSMIIWVGDSLNGNDIVTQVKDFDAAVGVSGTILTKVDVDVKGGSILSVAYALKKPIFFIGIGQEYDNLISFKADWLIKSLYN